MQLFKRIKRSVTTMILLIVLLCWAVPLLTIGGYSVFFYSNSINNRINDYLQNQFYYYNEFAIERLNTCVEQSRKASYDMTIEWAYNRYQSADITWNEFYIEADGYNRNRFYLNTRYLLSAFFLTDQPEQINFTSRNGMVDIDYYNQSVAKQVVHLSKTLGTDVGFIAQEGRIYLVRNMMRIIGPKKHFGVLVLQIDPEYLFAHMYTDNDDGLKNVYISLNDAVYQFTVAPYAPADQETGFMIEQTLLSAQGNSNTDDKNNIVFYNRKKTDDYWFGSAMALDRGVVFSRYRDLRNIIYVIWFLTLPITAMVVYFLHRNISRPIRSLLKGTSQIQQGEFGVIIDEEKLYTDEFSQLASSFNAMSAELKRLFGVVYKEELALKDAKILALQAQINPHFLNNTLELMNWQARMAGDTDVSLMIEALSTLLDSSMDRSDRRLIPLQEELASCDAYLYIIGKRFGKRITITKEIDESLLMQQVPRLILQPLLENSVIHGVEPVESGEVSIKIFASDDDHIIIQIINMGKSLTDHALARIEALLAGKEPPDGKMRLGIRNVNERIGLIYGTDYGLRIYRDHDGRTISEIRIPLDEQEEIG